MMPMLAAKVESETQLRYPVLATPKVDGIRCIKVNGRPLSRSFKPIRNPHVVKLLEGVPELADGELVIPDAQFYETSSSVMSFDGRDDLEFWCFDVVSHKPYKERVLELPSGPRVRALRPTLCENADALLRFEETCLAVGYEGVITRSPDSPYKYGRSSLREGYMVKLKRMHDSEAVVLAVEEATTNLNPIVPDAFGYARRPGSAANRLAKGTMGSLAVRDVHTGVEFSIGTGFDDSLRAAVWREPQSYIGRIVRYRCQKCGEKDKPRFPSFQGFRDPEDMT